MSLTFLSASFFYRGNKSQFKSLSAIKVKIDAAMILLDDMQLDEADASSLRYQSISSVKTDLQSALDLVDGRLDLIERVDASKVGWAAAQVYEKINGPLKKPDSDKNWAEAEKTTAVARRKEGTAPFRDEPGRPGKDSFYDRSRGRSFCFVFLLRPPRLAAFFPSFTHHPRSLCCLGPIPTGTSMLPHST